MGFRRYAPLLAWIALPAIILSPFLIGPAVPLLSRSTLGSDYLTLQLPNAQHFHETWQTSGRLPLWQPAFFSGVPVAGNPSYLLTYPPYWMVLFVPPVLALNVLFAIHLAWAGVGTWWFARRALGFRPESALLAGVAFAFGPKVLAHVSGGQLGVIIALAWFPFVLMGVWQAFVSSSWTWPWLAGAALGIMVVAHAPTALIFSPLILAVAIWRAIACVMTVRPAPAFFVAALVAGAAASGVGLLAATAAHLLPLAELLPYLHRSGIVLGDAAAFSLPAAVLPLVLALPTVPFPEWVIYPGAIAAMLAVLGARRGRLPGKWLWITSAIAAGLYALGLVTPLFSLAFQLPGFDLLRVPARAWFLVAFIVSLFAGAGLEAWLENPRAILRSGTIVLTLMLASSAALSLQPDAPRLMAIAAAAAAGVIFLRVSRPLEAGSGRAILISGLMALELGAAGWTFWRAGRLDPQPVWAESLHTRLAGTADRAYTEGALPAYQAIEADVSLIEGIDPVQLADYANLLAAAAGCETEVYSISSPPFLADPQAARDCPRRSMDSRILGLISTVYGIQPEGPPLRFEEGWNVEAREAGMAFYRNENAQPFARISGQVVVAQAPPSIEQLVQSPDVAWVEGGHAIEGGRPIGSAQVEWEGPDRLRVLAEADAPAFLTLAVPYLPGWRAFSGGEEQPVYRAAAVLMGVYLEKGTNELEFAYRPQRLMIGMRVALLAAALSAAAGLVRVVRARRIVGDSGTNHEAGET